jgi:hypothetical protein
VVESEEIVQPPSWWRAHSERVFADFRDRQRLALALIGRDAPLPVARVKKWLAERVALEQGHGDRGLFLHYPTASGPQWLEVWRGYTREDEWRAFLGDYPAAGDEADAHETAFRERTAARRNPLATIVELQDDIAAHTGVEPWEATGFLLCDEVPSLPWVKIKRPVPGGALEVVIGSLRVPPADVAAAYADYRRRANVAQRGRSTYPDRLAAEVRNWQVHHGQRVRWREIFESFKEQWPDAPYSNPDSMRASFYARKRLEEGRSQR